MSDCSALPICCLLHTHNHMSNVSFIVLLHVGHTMRCHSDIHMTHHCGPLPRRFAYPHVPSWNAVQHTQQMTSALGMCV